MGLLRFLQGHKSERLKLPLCRFQVLGRLHVSRLPCMIVCQCLLLFCLHIFHALCHCASHSRVFRFLLQCNVAFGQQSFVDGVTRCQGSILHFVREARGFGVCHEQIRLSFFDLCLVGFRGFLLLFLCDKVVAYDRELIVLNRISERL